MRVRTFVAIVFSGWASLAAAAPGHDYIRGYVDALLASHFPSLGLNANVLAANAMGSRHRVVVSADRCVGPWQRREVEQLLTQNKQIEGVRWDASADCEPPPPDAQSAVAPEPAPAPDIELHLLPESDLFAPMLADPRQPRFSVSYQRYRTSVENFNASSVALGEYFGLATGILGRSGASQVGIQGAVFALFNLDATSNDLINADYWIGLPVSYRKGPWSYVVRVYHQSSHLGDEFILGSPNVQRINLSYEDVEILFSHEWDRWRVYGGGGYLWHSEPNLERLHAQAGAEYVRRSVIGRLDLVLASDFQAAQELDWSTNQSYQGGFEFKSGATRRTRLMFEYVRGRSPHGQFYRDSVRYAGVGLYFGF